MLCVRKPIVNGFKMTQSSSTQPPKGPFSSSGIFNPPCNRSVGQGESFWRSKIAASRSFSLAVLYSLTVLVSMWASQATKSTYFLTLSSLPIYWVERESMSILLFEFCANSPTTLHTLRQPLSKSLSLCWWQSTRIIYRGVYVLALFVVPSLSRTCTPNKCIQLGGWYEMEVLNLVVYF